MPVENPRLNQDHDIYKTELNNFHRKQLHALLENMQKNSKEEFYALWTMPPHNPFRKELDRYATTQQQPTTTQPTQPEISNFTTEPNQVHPNTNRAEHIFPTHPYAGSSDNLDYLAPAASPNPYPTYPEGVLPISVNEQPIYPDMENLPYPLNLQVPLYTPSANFQESEEEINKSKIELDINNLGALKEKEIKEAYEAMDKYDKKYAGFIYKTIIEKYPNLKGRLSPIISRHYKDRLRALYQIPINKKDHYTDELLMLMKDFDVETGTIGSHATSFGYKRPK